MAIGKILSDVLLIVICVAYVLYFAEKIQRLPMQITLVAREITWMYQRITGKTQNAMHNK